MKPILDACCGGKMFYFDKNDPRVLFQDIRSFKDKDIYKGRTFSVEPDVVADFTSMPYPDCPDWTVDWYMRQGFYTDDRIKSSITGKPAMVKFL